jgi:hypothetical protein
MGKKPGPRPTGRSLVEGVGEKCVEENVWIIERNRNRSSRKLYNEEVHNLYCSVNTICAIKSMEWNM